VALKSKVWGAGVYGVDATGDMGIDLAKRGSHCTIRNEIIFDQDFCSSLQMVGTMLQGLTVVGHRHVWHALLRCKQTLHLTIDVSFELAYNALAKYSNESNSFVTYESGHSRQLS
jgi:hypothetical protein